MKIICAGKFKIMCPECGVTVITAHPAALVWELCPGCNRHIWDGYDTLMAESVRPGADAGIAINSIVH